MKAHSFLMLLLAVVQVTALASPVFAGDAVPSPFERQVRLDLWGATLADAIREIHDQSGVEIVAYPSDFPAQETFDNLYLATGRVGLGTVIECLARRYSFRYRVANSGRVELSRSYGWVGAETALRFLRLDDIASGSGDEGELRKFLTECVKPMALLPGDFSLAIEKSPIPDNPHALRAVAVLPPVLADYLERTIRCLSGEAGDYPLDPNDRTRLFSVARTPEIEWHTLLLKPLAPEYGLDARRFLVNAASQVDAAFILHFPGAIGKEALRDFPEEKMGLGKFTEEAAVRLQLGKRVFLAPGAVSFEPGASHEWEMDNRIRELFWDGLAVAGFPGGLAAERSGGGKELASRLRQNVFPGLWRDPVTAIVYSPTSGRLAVVAPPNVIEAVAKTIREWSGDS
ncbi:MAG: hypothetical protein FWG74_06370 [Planctomycetes bacterium]|nr:hypothetical protein [Planctomycetota bacterium]